MIAKHILIRYRDGTSESITDIHQFFYIGLWLQITHGAVSREVKIPINKIQMTTIEWEIQ